MPKEKKKVEFISSPRSFKKFKLQKARLYPLDFHGSKALTFQNSLKTLHFESASLLILMIPEKVNSRLIHNGLSWSMTAAYENQSEQISSISKTGRTRLDIILSWANSAHPTLYYFGMGIAPLFRNWQNWFEPLPTTVR